MNSYFAYIRVSTQRQGEHGVSLPEQKAAIERYAMREGFTISRWFEERETAAKEGRPVFREMVARLRHKEAQGLIMHKVDRSARNYGDWNDVETLADDGIEVHFANENLVLNSNPNRLTAGVQMAFSVNYIRNLREEVKKGMYGRFKQGILPLAAPNGYLDRGAGKPKEIDPVKGPLVRRAFALYSSGAYSLATLRPALTDLGLTNRSGGPLTRSGLATMLRNPFYIGLIHVKKTDEIFQGVHQPLITKDLFDKVQETLDGRLSARPKKHQYLFRRLLKCRSCGMSLVGETAKGRVYYRCHTPACRTSVREDRVELALGEVLQTLVLAPEERDYLTLLLKQVRTDWFNHRKRLLQSLRLALADLNTRLTKLTDAYLDGLLEKELFTERKNSLLLERRGLEERIAQAEGTPDQPLADAEKFLELVGVAYYIYESLSVEKRRSFTILLTSNRLVQGKQVDFTLVPAALLVANRAAVLPGGPKRDRPRTFRLLLQRLIDCFTTNPAGSEDVRPRTLQAYTTTAPHDGISC